MSDREGRLTGRVLRSTGGVYRVDVDGQVRECSLRGKLKKERGLGRVVVGDEVELELLGDDSCVITGIRPRRSKISRRSADGRREQIIAANVDQLAAVFSTRQPEPTYTMVDRLLALAEASETAGLLVVNKVDLTGKAAAREQFGLYERIGYPVLYTSAKTGLDVDKFRDRLRGRTTLLVGPSGAGKSTLLNAIEPGLGLAVGEVSVVLEKGRHTTVEASLHALERGGYVVDSPGLRKLDFWEVGEHELAWCFREFRPYLGGCKFPDCGHVHEPDCAIKEALADGKIERERYESYVRILEEQRSRRSY